MIEMTLKITKGHWADMESPGIDCGFVIRPDQYVGHSVLQF